MIELKYINFLIKNEIININNLCLYILFINNV
jgi:hypothetical protein